MQIRLARHILLIGLLIPLLAVANDGRPRGKYTKEKTIKREFDVAMDALLKVDNSYGNLNLSSWNEDRVLVEVHIKTNGNNEEKVQRKLDEIDVVFDAERDMVSARTVFSENKGAWSWWGKSNNVNMQIDYTIKLPVKNSVHLSNDYGGISIDRIDGHAKISCDYGRLEIGELRGRNNDLRFDYTSRSTIDYINSGEIRADYSGITIGKAGNLMIRADYTDTKIGEMKNLDYANDYGKIQVDDAANITGKGDYVSVRLGSIHGNLDITADYGSVHIDKLAEDAGNLQIRTNYTGIKIGYAPDYHFDFEITTEYAKVKGQEDMEVNISKEKSNSRFYQGYYGAKNAGNKVSIESDYGDISFQKNES